MRLCVWLAQHEKYGAGLLPQVELQSVASTVGVTLKNLIRSDTSLTNGKAVTFEVEDDETELVVRTIMARATCPQIVAEIYAQSDSHTNLLQNLKNGHCKLSSQEFQNLIETKGGTFAWSVHVAGCSESHATVVAYMESFAFYFNLKHRAKTSNPGVTLVYLDERYLLDRRNQTHVCFFGRLLAERKKRELLSRFQLSERLVLGPTTTDNQLAFLMANLAQVQQGDLVLDPFCGSCGLLIPATQLGALWCCGSDIDNKVLRGWAILRLNKQSPMYDKSTSRLSLFANYDVYGLPYPDLLRYNSAAADHNKLWRPGAGIFDKIVTDPPYGYRAASRSKQSEDSHKLVKEGALSIYQKLFELTLVLMKPGGLLVTLFPVVNDPDEELDIVLKLAADAGLEQAKPPCFQPLRELCGRWILTFTHHKIT